MRELRGEEKDERKEKRERERRGPEGEAKPNRAATKLAIRSFWVHKSWFCSDTVLECREKEREREKKLVLRSREMDSLAMSLFPREREREGVLVI